MRDLRYMIILTVVCAFLFFYGLGNMALTDPDETFYAQTAKEMLQADEWMTPMIFGNPQFEKPVLYYWLVEISFKFLGINEFAARLPSAVFGVIGCLAVYLMGRALFSPACGFLSGLITATCVQYMVIARGCLTDIVLAVFIILCFLFFLLALKRGRKFFYLASSAMAALAVLTKGPIGIFIPVVVIGLYFTLSRQWGLLRNIPIVSSVLVFFAISLPWYVAMLNMHGDALLSEFFGIHNIVRFLEPEHRIGSSPFFYMPVVLGGFFPWTAFLFPGAWYMIRSRAGETGVKAPGAFLLSWLLVIFLFFSASRTKLVTYIFPLFPVLSIVTGRFWEKFLEKGRGEDRLRRCMNVSYVLFALIGFAGLTGGYFVIRQVYSQVLQGAVLCGAVFAAGMVACVLFFLRGKNKASFYALVATVVLLTVPVTGSVLPVVEEFETSKAISYKVMELAEEDEAIGGESDHRRGIAFYTDRTDIVDIHPYPALLHFLSREERVWGVIQKKHYEQVRDDKKGLVSGPLFEYGEYVIITNK